MIFQIISSLSFSFVHIRLTRLLRINKFNHYEIRIITWTKKLRNNGIIELNRIRTSIKVRKCFKSLYSIACFLQLNATSYMCTHKIGTNASSYIIHVTPLFSVTADTKPSLTLNNRVRF